MCLGGGYGLARYVRGEKGDNIFYILAKTIFSSLPVLSYMLMIILALGGLALPQVVIDWVKVPASANTFLSMLMIGVALGLSLKKEYLHLIYSDIGLRLLISAVLYGEIEVKDRSCGLYQFLVYPHFHRRHVDPHRHLGNDMTDRPGVPLLRQPAPSTDCG